MKKVLLIMCMALLVSSAFAQSALVTMTGTATLTNADTADLAQTVTAAYETVSIQVVATEYSGTITGTAILKGSIDGTNFVNINTDTLTFVDQTTNTKLWVLQGSVYKYYKVTCITTTTVSAQVKAYLFGTGQGRPHASNIMLSDISASSDTVTNSGSGYVQLQVKGAYKSVGIQVVATKISGTNGGTVTLQGSNDGTNFVTVSTGYLREMATSSPYAISGGATLTVLDQTTTTKIFTVIGSPYAYYRLSHTGTGTMVSRLRGYLLPNY